MSTLQSLQRKLKTANELLSVVKTMKSLASVNIRHYEKAVESLEEYNHVVQKAWQVFFLKEGGPPEQRAAGPAVLLVIGTDQGMCGQFNDVVLKQTSDLAETLGNGDELIFWSAGERVTGGLLDDNKSVELQFDLPGSLQSVDTQVMEILNQIEVWHRERNVGRFYLVHNKTSRRGGYYPMSYKILPLDRAWASQYTDRGWPERNLPTMGVSGDQFFSDLFSQYLYISLFRAFGQSLAGENAARLASMQSAEKNIDEMIGGLRGRYQQQRQSEITGELFDIVAGVEALHGDEESAMA